MKCLRLAVLLVVVSCLCGCSHTGIDTDLKHYLNSGHKIDEAAADFLPALESLSEYESLFYQHYNVTGFFCTDSLLLEVGYDEPTYAAEKETLSSYCYLDHAVPDEDGDGYLIPEYAFTLGRYYFRVVETDGNEQDVYPHYFGIIGTSDESRSIAWLYFYDQDLDIISEDPEGSMADFVTRNFPYDWQ
jgi:hypothetical protein